MTAHVLACFFLTGLIWTIQLVHYPCFALAGRADFQAFHAFHSRRITWIVLPVMSLELATGAWLAYAAGGAWWWGLAAIVAIWIATGLLSVPAHDVLARGFDERAARRLVTTNWVRTFLWSARSVALAYWLQGVL